MFWWAIGLATISFTEGLIIILLLNMHFDLKNDLNLIKSHLVGVTANVPLSDSKINSLSDYNYSYYGDPVVNDVGI